MELPPKSKRSILDELNREFLDIELINIMEKNDSAYNLLCACLDKRSIGQKIEVINSHKKVFLSFFKRN